MKETDTLDRTVTTFSSVLFSSPDYILFLSVQKNNEAFTKAAVFASSVGISEYDEATGNVYIVTADESKLDFEYADGVLTCSIPVNAEGE